MTDVDPSQAVAAVTVPHFAFPFVIGTQPDGSLAAAVNEQDTLDDVLSCARATAACPIGAWIDQPALGIPNVLFAQTPVDASGVARAIARWDNRAVTLGSEQADVTSDAIRYVQINVTTGQQDQ